MAFSDVLSSIFGGTDSSAQALQQAANEASRQRIDTSTKQARSDALDLFQQGDVSRNQGFQGALDILSQSIPQQLQAFQGGNVGAQESLLAGLPQFQNAILGNQIDLSGLQPQTLAFDDSFTSQQLPFAQGQSTQGQNALNELAQLLGGGGNFSGSATGAQGQPGNREGGEGGRNGVSPASGEFGIGVDFATGLDSFLNHPLGRLLMAAIPGSLGTFAGAAGNLATDAIARNALGTNFDLFGHGDAIDALQRMGLTDRSFDIGGIETPNLNSIQFRDFESFGSPRAEDRAATTRSSTAAKAKAKAAPARQQNQRQATDRGTGSSRGPSGGDVHSRQGSGRI